MSNSIESTRETMQPYFNSAHGLEDIEEVKVFYYDLLNAGRRLNVAMLALSAFEVDIKNFEGATS